MLQHFLFVEPFHLIADRYLRAPHKLLLEFWDLHHEVYMSGTFLSLENSLFIEKVHAVDIKKFVGFQRYSAMQVILDDRKL